VQSIPFPVEDYLCKLYYFFIIGEENGRQYANPPLYLATHYLTVKLKFFLTLSPQKEDIIS